MPECDGKRRQRLKIKTSRSPVGRISQWRNPTFHNHNPPLNQPALFDRWRNNKRTMTAATQLHFHLFTNNKQEFYAHRIDRPGRYRP